MMVTLKLETASPFSEICIMVTLKFMNLINPNKWLRMMVTLKIKFELQTKAW